jgi:hypothetical protein
VAVLVGKVVVVVLLAVLAAVAASAVLELLQEGLVHQAKVIMVVQVLLVALLHTQVAAAAVLAQ